MPGGPSTGLHPSPSTLRVDNDLRIKYFLIRLHNRPELFGGAFSEFITFNYEKGWASNRNFTLAKLTVTSDFQNAFPG